MERKSVLVTLTHTCCHLMRSCGPLQVSRRCEGELDWKKRFISNIRKRGRAVGAARNALLRPVKRGFHPEAYKSTGFPMSIEVDS